MNSASKNYRFDWSVVVIARNEEKSIAGSIQSVLDTFSNYSHELIFVDSASEDRTLDIARQFPAKIIRLPESLPMRPSIAREAGRLQATGKWILFLDGDCSLQPGWLEAATLAMQKDKSLGGLSGEREEIITDSTGVQKTQRHHFEQQTVNSLGGCAAYNQDVLRKVGGFNPFLYSSEEAEFGARIRKAGYSLQILPVLMTRHFMKHQHETLSEILRRIRRGFPIGMGQIVRHISKYELPIQGALSMIRRHLQFYGLLAIGLLALLTSALTGNWLFLSAWLVVFLSVFILFSIKTRSLTKPAYYFFEWATAGPFIIWGILKTPRQWSDFDKKLLNLEVELPTTCQDGQQAEA